MVLRIAHGVDERSIEESEVVTASALNHTAPYSEQLYLLVTPDSGASKGDMKLSVTFRYYEYDPLCDPDFEKWNGTDCVAQYDIYCASLTDEYRE